MSSVQWRSIRFRVQDLVHWREITETQLRDAIEYDSKWARFNLTCQRSGRLVLAELVPSHEPVTCVRCILNGSRNWCAI